MQGMGRIQKRQIKKSLKKAKQEEEKHILTDSDLKAEEKTFLVETKILKEMITSKKKNLNIKLPGKRKKKRAKK